MPVSMRIMIMRLIPIESISGDVCFMCSNELTLDEIHGLSYDTLMKLLMVIRRL